MTSAPKRPNFARFLEDVERRLRVLERRLTSTGGGGAGPVVHGLPPGGDTGQVLTKRTSENFDADWENVPTSGGGGGGAPQVDVFTTAQNSTPYAIPAGATRVTFGVRAAGSGGGSGARQAATAFGGRGGGAGGWSVADVDAADLPSTVYLWVGAGGTGALAQSGTSANGLAADMGEPSFVTFSSDPNVTVADGQAFVWAVPPTPGVGGGGAGGNAIGGAGSTIDGADGAASAAAGYAGGGAGGGNNSNQSGGDTFAQRVLNNKNVVSIANTGTTVDGGGAGMPGADASTAMGSFVLTPLGGAGGGSTNGSGTGGDGGDGIHGGGGGGGGGSLNTAGASGAGGNGGDGYIIITTYF